LKKLKELLRDRNIVFLLAVAAGALTDVPTRWTQPLILPALGVIMTLSVLNVPNSVFSSPKAMLLPACAGIFLSYVLLGGVVIGLSFLLIPEPAPRAGYILIAASPPAIAILPFAGMLKGDESFTLFGVIGAYLIALPVLPLAAYVFLDLPDVSLMDLAVAAGTLVLLPVIVSRLLLWSGLDKPIAPARGVVTDWSFFLVIYTIVGLNRALILSHPDKIVSVAVVAFLSIIVLGRLIEIAAGRFHVERKTLPPLILLGTLKNYGLAGGIALSFFSKESALPAAVCVIFMVLNIIWLDYRQKRRPL
jgi:BASS family bile acid:Na+ symporter